MDRAQGRVQAVVQSLSEAIRSGAIEQGSKLPTESQLLRKFNVSRTVVREAMSQLQALGLVVTRHGIGSFALSIPSIGSFRLAEAASETWSDRAAIWELRTGIEVEAAALAAQRRSALHLAAMQACLQTYLQMYADRFPMGLEHTVDTAALRVGFYLEIGKATGNQHFLKLMTHLSAREPATPFCSGWQMYGESEDIFKAIRNQDADSARTAMRTHLANSIARVERCVDRAL